MHSLVRAAVAAVLGMTTVAPVLAQRIASSSENSGADVEATVGAAGTEAGAMDSIIVLGTAQKDVTPLTSTAPVDVITPEQLAQTGAVTINEALSKLHPSFNFPQGQNGCIRLSRLNSRHACFLEIA